jgi:hypothetical protein
VEEKSVCVSETTAMGSGMVDVLRICYVLVLCGTYSNTRKDPIDIIINKRVRMYVHGSRTLARASF